MACACFDPSGAVRFPATPELHGYPLRCMERSKEKGKERKENRQGDVWVAALPIVYTMYKAMRSVGRKEEDGRRRPKRERKKGKGSGRPVDVTMISSHPSLWPSLALSNQRRQPSQRLCGSHRTSSTHTRCSSSAGSRHQRGRLRTLLARACFVMA